MFDLNRLGENTYYIDCPTNFGLYVYDGKACLIDGGSDPDAAEKALSHITAHGWSLEMVICTHCHADHTGGCALLKSKTGCRVYAPGADASIINNPMLNPTYLFGGFPLKELHNRFLLMPQCECEVLTDSVLPAGLECIRLDGHSFAQVGIKTPDDVWFVADSVVSAKTLSRCKVGFIYNIVEYLLSLERLKTLRGKVFVPAHCSPVNSIAELAQINYDNTLEVAAAIKELCTDGLSIDELMEKLFARFCIKPHLMQYALVGFTVRSYLSWLCDRGEMTPVFEGTKLVWKTSE